MTTATRPKWTKDDGSALKNIYHSYLVREGRTMVKFKGDPRESKFKKGTATHYAYFQVPDDETEYCLMVEPECVEPIMNAPKDRWVMVRAWGSKDEPSGLIVEDGAGPVLPETEPVERDDGPPIPMWPDEEKPADKPVDPGIEYDAVAVAVSATVRAVNALHDAGIEVDPTPIYSTHYIQAARR